MIKLTDLSKRFDSTFVVDGVSLTIKEGEIVGLLGPNGAGKTTTLRMLAGVLPPSRGLVSINGKNMKQDDQQLKRQIGYLPENNPLYDELTVEEHLAFWAKIKSIPKQKQPEAISFAINHTGIKEVYYRPISELSKGYRQRAGLSQAILTQPKILILDEPTEGLDPNQRRDIQALIKKLGKESTIIIASHVLSEVAKICTRVVIIHKGKIVADSTPEELRTRETASHQVEVEIKGPRVASTLKRIAGVKEVTQEKPNYFVLEIEKDHDVREQIFKEAVRNKWVLLTMMRKEVELEDVFQELTRE